MKAVYFHLMGGAGGDMLLSALLDLGCPISYIKKEFSKLNISADIKINKKKSGHFFKKTLIFEGNDYERFGDIVKIIKNSNLDKDIITEVLRTYEVIACAEKYIHNEGGKTKDNIHFHHLGKIDAILEICGYFIVLKYLKIEKVYVSSFPLSLPAPAALEILKGKKIEIKDLGYESITPTAAALLKDAEQGKNILEFINSGIGWGKFGDNDYIIAYLFGNRDSLEKDSILKIETNIDDMNPQNFELLFDVLYENGAKEVYIEQVIMKKSRPAFVLNVLCLKENFTLIKNIIFTHTSTFGLRYQEYERYKLKSSFIVKETPVGKISFRTAVSPFKKEIPEYEDCLKAAKKLNLPLSEVYRIVCLREA